MKIKLILTSGKEIELTQEEFEELKQSLSETVYLPTPQPDPYRWPLITYS